MQEIKTRVPPKFTSIQSSGLIGSCSNQMLLSDATVKKYSSLLLSEPPPKMTFA